MRTSFTGTIIALLILPCLVAAEEAPSVADTTDLVRLTPEELFLRASSSALQFESLRQPARRLLIRNHEKSVPYLVTQLDTDDARERHALEDIFVKIGSPAVGPLINALGREIERADTTRGARLAASVLGRIGDSDAVSPLIDARGHPDWKVRGAVAGALGRIGDARAAPALVELLADANEIVRKGAAVGLARIADSEDGGAPLGEEEIDALAAALADPYYSVRWSAARALAAAGRPAVGKLTELAGDGEGVTRLLAVHALGEIGERDAARRVRDLLESDDWTVAAYAAEALGKIGLSGSDREALRRMLEGEVHPFVAHKIEGALAAGGS